LMLKEAIFMSRLPMSLMSGTLSGRLGGGNRPNRGGF
jgi:hypothetical protein